MALLFFDTCGDNYTTAFLPGPWANATGTVAVVAGYTNKAISCSGNGIVSVPYLNQSGGTLVFGFRCMSVGSSLGGMFIGVNPNYGVLVVNADGSVQWSATGGGTVVKSASGLFAFNVWNYLELVIGNVGGSGTSSLWLNNVEIASGTVNLALSLPLGNAQIGTNILGGGGAPFLFDDFYCLDDSGSDNTSRLGPQIVQALMPSANGRVNQWTPSSGPNYTCVNAIPPGAQFVSDATSGHEDCYALPTIMLPLNTVKGVAVQAYANQSSGGTRTIALGVGNGTSEAYASPFGLSTAQTYITSVFNTNPLTTNPWSLSDLPLLQSAIKDFS